MEGKSRQQSGGKEFVDIVRVEVVDWRARVSFKINIRGDDSNSRRRSRVGMGMVFYLSPLRSRRAVPC